MIDSLVLFKSELERKLKISKWSPTDSDIAYIAKKIATGEAQSRAEIVRLVLEVFQVLFGLALKELITLTLNR